MTKLKFPLLGARASGSLSKLITFATHKKLNIAKSFPTHPDAKSDAQLSQRSLFQDAAATWNSLTDEEKLEYYDPARKANLTTYQYFMHCYLMAPPPTTFIGLTDTPDSYDGQAGKYPKVNTQENALEFAAIAPSDLSLLHEAKKRWHISLLLAARAQDSAVSLSANRLWAVPYPLPIPWTVDRIGVHILTAATGSIRLGIYSNGTDCYPGDLLLDAGTVDCSTTGPKEIPVYQELPAALYWLACLSDANPQIPGFTHFLPILGGASPYELQGVCYYIAYTYGALPATFPSGATIHTILPGLALRRSA